MDMSGLLETNFNLASKILFRRNGPARLRNFQAMSFPLQYLSARHVFMLFFFVVSVLFWSFFSFVSLFCFSFPFVYFSIFSNPGWHASLFESSNLAKCFKFAGRRTLMICCTWRWLKIMTPLTGSEIARP